MPEKWTKRSRPPPSGVMNPKPFSSENHLTVPVPTEPSLAASAPLSAPHSSTGRCVRSQTEQTLYTQPPGTQPARPHAAWRCLRGQLGSRRRDLLAVARRRVPGQPQRVAGVTRDHVDVEVEDGLPGRLPARVEQVHAVRVQTLVHARGHQLGGART